MQRIARVLTVSDRSAAGVREDRAGPLAVGMLRDAGWDCADAEVVPDGADSVEAALRRATVDGPVLVVTTGGTGVGPRDATPEGTARVLTRVIPGIGEELRRSGVADTPLALISRGLAGVVEPAGALVVNLPGSPRAVAAGIPVVLSVAAHVLDQLAGGDHG
jgi:molybdenum cofactor synthesis domain-containing protein